ncbi:MAG: phosphate ABC transporter ATP-binding protein [Nitrososphaerota archaeon]|nr:phosphate ABC transporter ATP-binding protein [Candidatus Geocrenenecus dongiae]
MSLVEISNLNAWYGDKHVLKNINLEIPRNIIFAIMGPSGCGKSTLLRAMNRLLELNPNAKVSGQVKIDGIDVYSDKIDITWVRRQFGMVFQIPNPFPHLSIYDNVAIGPRMNGLVKNKSELDQLVKWALEKAYLWDEVKNDLKKPASMLSGGQQQRLCIARALALKPKIILMDEPTANLDPVAASKIEELMLELKEDYTIVIVTHNPQQAARVSDYVAFLYMGELIEVGETSQVFTRPVHKLTERYVVGKIG